MTITASSRSKVGLFQPIGDSLLFGLEATMHEEFAKKANRLQRLTDLANAPRTEAERSLYAMALLARG